MRQVTNVECGMIAGGVMGGSTQPGGGSITIGADGSKTVTCGPGTVPYAKTGDGNYNGEVELEILTKYIGNVTGGSGAGGSVTVLGCRDTEDEEETTEKEPKTSGK